MLLERIERFSEFITERKKGELKSSLLLVFGMFALIITVCSGLLGDPYLVLASVYAWGFGDAAAALIGKRFGKHKFSKISPNKTIEGCIFGTVGSIIMIMIYTIFLNLKCGLELNYTIIAIMAFVLSIIGQIGDFAASSIKRYVDVKDYSNLIPGHGGMLDRIDSLMFLAPFAYMFFSII